MVNKFLATELGARALAFAFDRGWVALLEAEDIDKAAIAARGELSPQRFELLWGLLVGAGIIEGERPARITAAFREALGNRDLLFAKLWFANTVAPDVHQHFDALLTDTPRFMAEARVFELFRYDRCLEVTPENLRATRRWVDYTTVLTTHEAPHALDALELGTAATMLDVGGNSGEFARQACARAAQLTATVFDLPVVCELGRQHVRGKPGGARVQFRPGDLRAERLGGAYDLVSFKSVLHDWPDIFAREFLTKAWAALRPGGRLVIFERLPVTVAGELPYWMVANLVFLPFFRGPELYLEVLRGFGAAVDFQVLELETPFMLVVAVKP